MKCVAIVQARMTSTRLPGKILADVAGRPMLAQQLRRMGRCTTFSDVVVATTSNATDDPVVELARREGVAWFRGDEHDVLSRFLGAARASSADAVVRLTGDCPLLDPAVTDEVVRRALDLAAPCDYASNTLERSWPRGLDVEVLHRDVLERVARLARSAPAREHVTWFLHRERPELFQLASVRQAADDSDLRWTVDTEADLALIRRIFVEAGLADAPRPYAEVVAFVRAHADLMALNAHIAQATA